MPKSAKFKVVHPDTSTCPIPDPRIEQASSWLEVDEVVSGRPRQESPHASCPDRVMHVVVPVNG